MKDQEEWRSIVGYEGIYEVSSHGRVRSLDRRDASGNKRTGKVLRQALDRYYFVNLSKDGVHTVIRVHLLVARAFIGPCPQGLVCNHKDTIKTNNHHSNLEYITQRENSEHAARNGCYGSLSPTQVRAVRLALRLHPKTPMKLLASALGTSITVIRQIAKAKTYTLISDADGSLPQPIDLPKTTLTVELITSLQAQGMTLPQIAKHFGLNYSTPYQMLRRSGIWRIDEETRADYMNKRRATRAANAAAKATE